MEEDRIEPSGPFAWLGRNKVVSAIIFVLFVALVTGALGFWDSPVKIAGKRIPPAASTESFARGQASFDAKLIWSSLSDDFTEALQSQGQEVDTIQSQLDAMKDQGVKYTEVTYVGGSKTPKGESYYLYLFSRMNSDSPGDIESVPYVFVVNQTGKIERIE